MNFGLDWSENLQLLLPCLQILEYLRVRRLQDITNVISNKHVLEVFS